MTSFEKQVLIHLYKRLVQEKRGDNRVLTVLEDYEALKDPYFIVDMEVVRKVNQAIVSLADDGYLCCPYLKDLESWPGYVKFTQKGLDFCAILLIS